MMDSQFRVVQHLGGYCTSIAAAQAGLVFFRRIPLLKYVHTYIHTHIHTLSTHANDHSSKLLSNHRNPSFLFSCIVDTWTIFFFFFSCFPLFSCDIRAFSLSLFLTLSTCTYVSQIIHSKKRIAGSRCVVCTYIYAATYHPHDFSFRSPSSPSLFYFYFLLFWSFFFFLFFLLFCSAPVPLPPPGDFRKVARLCGRIERRKVSMLFARCLHEIEFLEDYMYTR